MCGAIFSERRMMIMENNRYKYLNNINSPNDVKELTAQEISELCSELRDCIVTTTEKNGGHLASNLGAVELTLAVHRVFDCPRDHIIFDVGHQSYTHKLLTGRYNRFDTLRRSGGISGFTNRAESEYDCFGAGHSSTSLSAALGFAESDRLCGNDAYTVVILGDGAFTGGMIHEALNNCNKKLQRLVIILNENEMSISKNIGSFANSIARLRKKSGYVKAKRFTVSFIKKIPLVGRYIFNGIKGIKKSIKNALYGSNYFEDMGLYYLGPADGNDYASVEQLLKVAKSAGESVLIHLKTQKGKGYEPAEANPDKYHGIPSSEKPLTKSSYSLEFGNALCDIAKGNDKICAITAAMSSGTGLDRFAGEYKDRFFDVGIAEEHAVTFAAGLSANGMRPVVAVYSTFLQRSYDQIIHDVALQNLPVVFCIDRAGFNDSDGATHHGIFDVAFLSEIPNVKIYTPVTYLGLRRCLETAIGDDIPSAIRYPSGCEDEEVVNSFYNGDDDKKIGIRCDFPVDNVPKNIIITHGRIVKECLKAKRLLAEQNIDTGIILCEYIAPYEKLSDQIGELLSKSDFYNVIFVEEEIRSGGFGMLLADKMLDKGYLDGIAYDIMATDDPFSACLEGQKYIEAASLDYKHIFDKMYIFNKGQKP